MQLIHKVMDFEVGRVDEESRSFWAVASTPGPDRQGDLIDPSGWELANFMKNPVIPWAHDYTRPPVAKALAVRVEDGRLVFQAQFPPAGDYKFADTVYRLYRGGFLRAFSVGFCPLDSEAHSFEKDGRLQSGNRYTRQELYEISCVTIPANPEALVYPGAMPSETLALLAMAGGRHAPGRAATPDAGSPATPAALVEGILDRLIAGRLRYHLG